MIFLPTRRRVSASPVPKVLDFPLMDLLHSCPDPIWCIRLPDFKLVFLTLGAERLLGIPLGELPLRASVGELLVPEDLPLWKRFLQEAQERGEARAELRVRRGDGGEVWLDLRGVLTRDERGQPRYLTGIAVDVSDRRRAEDALRRSEARWRAVLNSTGDAFLMADQGGAITDCNEAFLRLGGYRKEEVLGLSLRRVVPEDQLGILDYQWHLGALQGQCDYEVDLLCRDGTRLPVWVQADRVLQEGEPPLLFAFLRDLSASRKVQEEQRHQVAFLRTLLDTIPSPVFYKDAQGRYLGCNRAFLDLVGRDLKEVEGRTAQEFLPASLLPQVVRSDMELLRHPGTLSFETPWQEGKGGERHFVVQKASFGDEREGVLGFVGVMVEITERKRMEEDLREARDRAESSSEAKMAFLSHMSHEIRTPMNAIVGLSELLLEECPHDPQREQLRLIREASGSLMELLGDILDLSKIEAGRLELDHEPFDLEETCRSVCSLLGMEAKRKGLAFSWDVAPSAQGFFLGDSFRLRQVLWNLVGNAVKFTERGRVHVTALGEQGEGGARKVHFRVQDTGIGILPVNLERIFEYFSQGETLLHRRFPGTGLGLSISRHLVRAMGGEILVASEPGAGSVFSFSLVLSPAPEGVRSGRPGDEGSAPLPEGVRVLLAEDNPANRKLMAALLGRLHWQIREAATGEEALRLFVRTPFDLVLLDIQMPELDGLEVARRIRALEKARSAGRVLLVALTAFATKEDRRRCLEVGMDEYLPKPVTPVELRRTLGGLLSRRASSEEEPEPRGEGRGASVTDLEVLRAMTEGDEELMREFVEEFLQSLPEQRAVLDRAYRDQDEGETAYVLHRLKGGASYLGGREMESLSADLMTLYRAGRGEEARPRIPELLGLLARAEEELREEMEVALSGAPSLREGVDGEKLPQ